MQSRFLLAIFRNSFYSKLCINSISNSTYSPPEDIDSGPIPGQGGSFIHTFTKDGIYDYSDQFNPSIHGRIYVSFAMEKGNNMSMLIGGKLPFNPKQARSILLSFVPNTVSILLQQ
jgi:hypothetical protein